VVALLLLVFSQTVLAVAPAGDFTVDPGVPEPGELVTFSSTGVADPDGVGIASVQWDFGDGAGYSSSDDPATHTYATPGTRTVKMLVTDSDNETTTVEKSIRVNAPPVPTFTVEPTPPQVAEQLTLDASGSTDDQAIPAAGYDWELEGGDDDFDDATGSSVNHTYSSAGTKTVKLRVTDSDGKAVVHTDTVEVNAPPEASFTTPPSLKADQTVTFTSSSSDADGDTLSYAWDLDNDGTFDTTRPDRPHSAPSPPAGHTASGSGLMTATAASTRPHSR